MNPSMFATLAFLAFMVFVFSVLVGALIYAESQLQTPPQTTTSSTLVSTTSSTSSTTSSIFASTTQIQTTTSTLPGVISVTYSPKNIYHLDDVYINMSSSRSSDQPYVIYLNGLLRDQTHSDTYSILSVSGGEYEVIVSRHGFKNVSVKFDVDKTTYGNSKETSIKLSPGERQKAIGSGKASVRFYGSSSCSICASVRPRLNKLVDDNRECVVYEKLSAVIHPEEVLPGLLPTIVVEGRYGLFKISGMVSMDKVKDMIKRASGCGVN
ncbi:MAG: hypothetical protein KKD39_05730 [Candidatus Altiarchaeota archaeon]|nr:hypothetical protein [Candidatus Altiarchaeota archaeon]